MKSKILLKKALLLYYLCMIFGNSSFAINEELLERKVQAYLEEIAHKAKIPGLSIALVFNGKEKIINYGYVDKSSRENVTSNSLFQIGSCSKAFTALAITMLEKDSLIHLDDEVSDYISWFSVYYKDEVSGEKRDTTITLRQLLHHTSGIPWTTISDIPKSNRQDALEQTVRKLVGIKLREIPGKEYEYATINYDVLALVVEKVTQQPFEVFLQSSVIDKLNLSNTTIGIPKDSAYLSEGYKISFFRPRVYEAPIYKGNNAAGYVISNIQDIARWMKVQMGLEKNDLSELIEVTHQRDKTVPLHGMTAYGRGWEISLDGTGEIFHQGLNPNYSSYIVFRKEEKIGVAILANSNSPFTPVIGDKLMKILASEKIEYEYSPGDHGDTSYSLIFIAILLYILVVVGLIVYAVREAFMGRRKFAIASKAKVRNFIKSVVCMLPFLVGLYVLPEALAGFSWDAIWVWSPNSFYALIVAILLAIGISYLGSLFTIFFPEENIYKRKAPLIILLSILSGLSNMVVIIIVTSSIGSEIEVPYLIYYYALAIGLYLLGRLYVQASLIKFTRGLVYELRTKLTKKIFATSFQNFEKIDRGRVYTALNDDVNTLSQSTNLIVTLITSIITAVGAFLYLASIAFWATSLTIFLIISLAAIYYVVSERTHIYFEQARDERNIFMRLINGLIDGYKELSLQRGKKNEFQGDVSHSAQNLRDRMIVADIHFLNAFLIGESLLVVLLGFIAFGIPEIFTNIPLFVVMSFVVVLLYLIGPINAILGAIPAIMQIKIAWNRLNGFIDEIPEVVNSDSALSLISDNIESLKTEAVTFSYDGQGTENNFHIGPITFEACSGEIIFIVGGNGSGKTTFSKLLTGLYQPDTGNMFINDREVTNAELGEYFSTAFAPPYLFEKLYNIDLIAKQDDIQEYLELLKLSDKVEIANGRYSTLDLSNGQRKRLALLQCYLEDRPIYLFDEWAADQDPEFRKFFYHTLLPRMKQDGKIIIAITHDDHYFHIADKILKMDLGKLQELEPSVFKPL